MLKVKGWLQLQLLGGCEIKGGEETIRFESNKVRALLVYLAMNPIVHQRDKLINLLWGDFPEANARRNLRHTLWNLRKQISTPDSSPILQADSQTIAINPQGILWLDVTAFQDAVRGSTGKEDLSALSALSTAMELYKGDFLDGFHVREAALFDEWALVERERLRTLALATLQRLAGGYASHGEEKTALPYARRWLAMSPWQEEAHRQVMGLLAATGQREAALAQYETCRQTLAAELGVSPDQETTQLYERIKAESGREDVRSAFTLQAAPLPLPPTAFIGREKQITELSEILVDPNCRLLTITGPGGIGKTRLALQTVSQISGGSSEQAVFVPLVDLIEPKEIIPAIVNTLGVTPFDPGKPRAGLLEYLREKRGILLLDNFEHLLDGAPLIREILDAAPYVKVLVTSRERLNLQGEWVYPLEGMEESEAVQLFKHTARRLFLGLTFEGEEPYLTRICHLVDGMPLALELAAAWVRVLTCQEIVAELESQQGAAFLSHQLRDVPERHRSLGAVFEHSWDLLGGKEKNILMYLSVFRGGFRREAAEAVALASLSDLSVLVDKSLLRRQLNGRYELHGLIRDFAAEKLRQSGDEVEIRRRHLHYYCHLLVTHQDSLRDALKQMKTEIDNLRSGWWWAVDQEEWPIIEELHEALYVYFEVNSAFKEGEAFFYETLKRITGVTEPGELEDIESDLLTWKLLATWSALTCRLGQLDVSRETFSRCADSFRHHNAQKELAFSLFYLGDAVRLAGDLDQAREYLEESLAIYRELGNRSEAAFALNVLGLVAAANGEHTNAQKLLEESRGIFREFDHPWGLAIVNINLGGLLKALGYYPEATALLQESLSLCQELGHRWAAAVCLNHLGDLAQLQGDLPGARNFFHDSFSLHQEIGHLQGTRGAILRLATLLEEQGELIRALGLLLKYHDLKKDDAVGKDFKEQILALKSNLSEDEYQEARELSRSKSVEEILEN